MNNEQQKLYDNLLKKVNEYCLGFAAEDVIESIDALVDNYEKPKVDTTSKPLEALERIANIEMKEQYEFCVDGARYKIVADDHKKDIQIIENSLKALEIIKEKLMPYVEKYKELGYTIECDMIATGITQEEYKLLKEILK